MPDSGQQVDLRRRARRRLIGAIALVLALVIVPPWIMDLEPRPVTTDLKVEIPAQDTNRLKPPAAATKTPEAASAPPKADAPPTAEAKPVAPPAPEKPKAEAPKPAAKTEKVARAAPSSKSADAQRAEAILNAEGFVVQLGVFADKENAKKLEARLGKAGVKHYTESVAAAGGEQIRVRAGPFPTRDAAEQAREQLKGMGLAPGPVIARQ
ncbi:MAG TPA: SPOR domain-containing protein [Burkholderiales bacterium]|jgi:DedD protein|nr:SPOR domain-containing protein [Burkholderiales bacterium]